MGGPGAAIGYCQALFGRAGAPDVHTTAVLDALHSIDAPWARSHELYWGYRQNETADEFIGKAIAPLAGSGRVPVLISGLDPADDVSVIREILESKPPVFSGETILLRLLLKSEDSIGPTAALVKSILDEARRTASMPLWFPLLQATFDVAQWARLKGALGEDWHYLNIAVNPFGAEPVLEEVGDQITVAQFVVGAADGLSPDGRITIPTGMKIYGAPEPPAAYNLFDYAARLRRLPFTPTCIVLGPSAPEWTYEHNLERLGKFLPLFREASETVWSRVAGRQREVIWGMSA